MARKDALEVKITSPRKIIWQGEAEAVSSENSQGPFDILPEHANFITLIKDHPIVVHMNNKETEEFSFTRAVIHTEDDVVTIYAELDATDHEVEEVKS